MPGIDADVAAGCAVLWTPARGPFPMGSRSCASKCIGTRIKFASACAKQEINKSVRVLCGQRQHVQGR